MLNKFAMVLALGAGIALVGCNGGDTANSSTTGSTTAGGTAGGKTYNISVIPKGSTHEYWKAVHAGANDAGAKFGATINFNGPLKEDDRDSQINMVENVINSDADAIVLAPLDSKALVKPVQEAIAKKKPVVIIDSALDGSGFVSFVATDNVNGGKLDADEMIKRLNGKGKIVVLRYAVNSASTEDREKGFEDEIKAKGPGITIVSDNQY
ncbi:MAG: substrate-binding domain-containing protein, partial [Fimbriimonadaceae bacterium]